MAEVANDDTPAAAGSLVEENTPEGVMKENFVNTESTMSANGGNENAKAEEGNSVLADSTELKDSTEELNIDDVPKETPNDAVNITEMEVVTVTTVTPVVVENEVAPIIFPAITETVVTETQTKTDDANDSTKGIHDDVRDEADTAASSTITYNETTFKPETEDSAEKPEQPDGVTSPSPTKRHKKHRTALEALTSDSILTPTSFQRERKQVGVYEPENFKDDQAKSGDVTVSEGRGIKLGDIPNVKDNVNKSSPKDPILIAAHKFLFGGGGRGRSSVPKKLLKPNILAFSGFLAPIGNDEDEQKRKDMDEDAEAKMATRAYKMTLPLLKTLCDFFDVDRSPPDGKAATDKDTLIDRLLDFLGAPSKRLAKNQPSPSKKRGRPLKSMSPTPKKRARKHAKVKAEAESEDPMSEDDDINVDQEEDDEDDGTKMPSDKALRKWVRAYVNCFNLDKATTKHAIETASDKFGMDLQDKKARIKELLTEEMS